MSRNLLQHFHNALCRHSLQLSFKTNHNLLCAVLPTKHYVSYNSWSSTRNTTERGLCTSAAMLARNVFNFRESKGATPNKLRGPIFDESDNVKENIDALEAVSLEANAGIRELDTISDDSFQLYPDETTGDTLFNGIKYVNV